MGLLSLSTWRETGHCRKRKYNLSASDLALLNRLFLLLLFFFLLLYKSFAVVVIPSKPQREDVGQE